METALLGLTTKDAITLIGKTIKWNVKGYGGQNYGGVAKIVAVETTERRPLKTECISGDNLDYAFNEWGAGNKLDEFLCYSDGDRWINYEEID